jgi:uncharacterized membrane protein YhiD involved in acid resistance
MISVWEHLSTVSEVQEPAEVMAGRLVLAVGFGCAIALARGLSRPDTKPSPGFRTTLVLLTVLAALVTEVIGTNLARAFGLAVALAVVRFRTVVDDTRDSAFVIFALAIGMAVGAGYLATAAIGLPVVASVAVVARLMTRNGTLLASQTTDAFLEIRLKTGSGAEIDLPVALAKFGTNVRLVQTGTTKEGDGLDIRYILRPRPDADPTAFVLDLKARPGVDKVNFAIK